MSDLDNFLNGDQGTGRARFTLFDYTNKIIIPVLTIVATIVVGWNERHPYLLRALVAMMIFVILIGPVQWLWSAVRAKVNEIREERAARKSFAQLKQLVYRFGDFVTGKADTLHYIADNYLCRGQGQRFALLGMPNVSAWSGRADFFSRKLDRQKPSVAELRYAVLDYYDMVGTYVSLCATLVFDRLPADLATTVDAPTKRELNAFQQHFESFRSDSQTFLKEVSQSYPSLSDVPHFFAAVKPLV